VHFYFVVIGRYNNPNQVKVNKLGLGKRFAGNYKIPTQPQGIVKLCLSPL